MKLTLETNVSRADELKDRQYSYIASNGKFVDLIEKRILHVCGHVQCERLECERGIDSKQLLDLRANVPCKACHKKMLDEIYTEWI